MTAARPLPPAWRRSWPPPRLRAAWALAAAVLLLHGWLLATLPRTAGPGWRAQPAKAVQVRLVKRQAAHGEVAVAPPFAPPIVSVTAPVRAPAAAQPDKGDLSTQAVTRRIDRDDPPAATPQPSDPTPALAWANLSTPAQPAAETDHPAAQASSDPGGQDVPVYATRLPPAQTLIFELRRGAARGHAELDWQPSGSSYQLTLQGQAMGAAQLDGVSLGGLDANGLAPLRYTEGRRGRALRAVNFERDAGRVSFSGPQIEYPLVAGGQDRLSWMVQLAAVMAANPELAQLQAQVAIWVVGTRGDAEVWTFNVRAMTALDLPVGRVEQTIHLVREPRRPYDTQVQVWLDPARHHLPVQAFLTVRATGLGTEFRLRDLK